MPETADALLTYAGYLARDEGPAGRRPQHVPTVERTTGRKRGAGGGERAGCRQATPWRRRLPELRSLRAAL